MGGIQDVVITLRSACTDKSVSYVCYFVCIYQFLYFMSYCVDGYLEHRMGDRIAGLGQTNYRIEKIVMRKIIETANNIGIPIELRRVSVKYQGTG